MSIPHSDELQSKEFWTGLRNTDQVTCQDEGCDDKLYWHSDDSDYGPQNQYEHIPGHSVRMSGNNCVRYKGLDAVWPIGDSNCNEKKRYVCEFICLT